MAIITFPAYSANYMGWNTYDITCTTSDQQWVVSCFVPDGRMCNIDGVLKESGTVYLVGTESIIPEEMGCTWSYTNIAGTGDPNYLLQFTARGSVRNGYAYYESATGASMHGTENADYYFPTLQDLWNAIDNGEITPIKPDIFFDVYINGSEKPSIFINWTADEELNIGSLQPRVWIECEGFGPGVYELIQDGSGYWVPNEGAWFVDNAGTYSYAGSYETTYLSVQEHFEQFLNAVSKLLQWGADGDPAYIRFLLRMDKIGEGGGMYTLERVQINKDATYSAEAVANSASLDDAKTTVRFHVGEPDYIPPDDSDDYPGGTNIDDDGPGRYDPDDIPDPADFTDPGGFDGNAVLTRTYAVSDSVLQNIGQKLWSQDYFNVLKIQSNPIENIISVKHFPFAMTGTSEEIKVGDVAFGIQGNKVASVQHLHIGSYTWTGKFHNFLDLSPYTSVKINLPYCGLFSLDPADIYGAKIDVDYYIDLVTGQCMAKLSLDGKTLDGGRAVSIPYLTVYGQMGIDIPLTSSDRVQTELRAASAAVTAMGGVAGHVLSGNVGGGVVSGLSDALSLMGSDYTSQRTSSQSPACTAFACQDIFLLIETPTADVVEQDSNTGYRHLHGYPCHKYKTLGSFPQGSFVQIEKRTDINIAMTSEENRMLEELLTSGVYI